MACRAVISAPERSAASTTITPSDRPLMMRFRCGNVPPSGAMRGGDSLTKVAAGGDFVGQLVVLGRIDVQHAAGQHGDRAPAGRQRAAMGGGVDAAGQAADDRQARAGQAAGQPLGLPQAVLRGVPRADNGDGQRVLRLRLAAAKQHAGRIVNLPQRPRIIGDRTSVRMSMPCSAARASSASASISSLRGGDLRREIFGPMPVDRLQLAGRRRQHRGRRAEPLQQRLPHPRPDAGDERQAHAVDQIVGEQRCRPCDPIRASASS